MSNKSYKKNTELSSSSSQQSVDPTSDTTCHELVQVNTSREVLAWTSRYQDDPSPTAMRLGRRMKITSIKRTINKYNLHKYTTNIYTSENNKLILYTLTFTQVTPTKHNMYYNYKQWAKRKEMIWKITKRKMKNVNETGLLVYSTATTCQLHCERDTKRYLCPSRMPASVARNGDHCQGTYNINVAMTPPPNI